MNLKHQELTVDPENPFKNCKLGREKYASALTSIVSSYPSGFVLAINNKWGAGKTTFIRMWQQELISSSYKTLYFNAWENDFEDNPLTALMGELKTLSESSTKQEFKKALKSAATLSKHLAPLLVQAIADKYINTALIKDVLVNGSKGITDLFEEEVNQYVAKKKSIQEFRNNLAGFIAKASQDKPLIFIVDELDRCRPNYAVSILEQIKHFFSVPNIVFVLSIDKTQLGYAIRGVYGSDRIDSDEYLRRFIDLEYSIPEPEKASYYKYLYDYFDFDGFLISPQRDQYSEFQNDKEDFLTISKLLFDSNSVSLRQQEKIYSHARIALRTFNANVYVVPMVYLLLTYIKVINHNLYNEIKSKSLTIQDLQQRFYLIFKNSITVEVERDLMRLEVYLILYYNNFLYTMHDRSNIYSREITSGKRPLLVKSLISPANEVDFSMLFQHIESKQGVMNFDMSHFFKKIDLTEGIRISS